MLNVTAITSNSWRFYRITTMSWITSHDLMSSMRHADAYSWANVSITRAYYIHSQTNDQTKRQNIVFEHYLRIYWNYKQNNWSTLLFMTTFVYNNNKHSNIDQIFQKFLFECVANLKSEFVNNLQKKKTTLTTNKAKMLRNNKTHLMNLWKRISKQQIKYYNENHIMKNFESKEKMLLREINIRTLRFKKKIDHKQLNFFKIVEKINTQTYEFDLFTRYEFIHFVFHVFLFKLWYNRDNQNSKSQSILMKNEKRGKIAKMLDKRVKKSQFQYFISWVNLSSYENSWKSMKHFENAKDAIVEFENEREKRKFERVAKRRKTNKFKIKLNKKFSTKKQTRQSLKLKKRERFKKQK